MKEQRRYRHRVAVVVCTLAIALSGCAASEELVAPPITAAPIVNASPELILLTPEPAAPTPDPASPTPDPAELAAAAEDRAATEAWVRELDLFIEPPIAAAFEKVASAYAGGSHADRSVAVAAWVEALNAAGQAENRWRMQAHDQCWGRIAETYADAFSDMGRVADDLATSLLPGLPASMNPGAQARLALRDLEASYHPELAGRLDADAIERLCAVSRDPARPIPAPDGPVTANGLRFGEPTVVGRWAAALVENTTDEVIGLGGTNLRFFDAKGQPLKGVYFGYAGRDIGPHSTSVVEFAGEKGAPKGWKTARIDSPNPPAPPDTVFPFHVDPPLAVSEPTSTTTSLGMLVAVQVTNTSDQTWCAVVEAVAVRAGHAVASGRQWQSCAMRSGWTSDSWPGVVRLVGDAHPGDGVYVELRLAGPE